MIEKTKIKNEALKTFGIWQNNAVQLLIQKGVDLSRPSMQLGRRIEAMVVARAYAESQDKPKIALKYEYASVLFTEGRGLDAGYSLSSFLPNSFVINKMFIPFSDQSALVLNSPSEETVMFAKYCATLLKSEGLAKNMGVKGDDLRMFKKIIDLVEVNTRVEGLSSEEMDALITRETSLSRVGHRALVQINLSPTKIPLSQAIGVLSDFLSRPTDTVSQSVVQLIQKEFSSKK